MAKESCSISSIIPDNPYAHYTTTGPEIWQQTGGRITHFVSSMGTTGTITGVSRFMREQSKPVTIVGLQPEEGSSIPGIRRWPTEYLPGIFNASLVDEVLDIHQRDAENTMRELAVRGRNILWRQLRRRGCRSTAGGKS
ncbi:cysteine synthase B [Escherichia coli]|uniref:cysteine synthase n=1 Tax=Escherichia coli TaxID=562 RepID=A0A2X1N5F9_ECOLX|nr:cysteine synthase B [Escherichia coli]